MDIGYGPMLEHMRKKCEKKGYFQQKMPCFSHFTVEPKICDCEFNKGTCDNTCKLMRTRVRTEIMKFKLGERVIKTSTGYAFSGIVIGVFKKLNGKIRYAIENGEGIVHIFNENSLMSTGYFSIAYTNLMVSDYPKQKPKYSKGTIVEKTKGDYTYSGTVICSFYETNKALRYCVEDDRGLLFIFNEASLTEV